MAKSKRKLSTAIIACITAVALVLSGTFAWQSISQEALNEASDVINPGGRLHDDFSYTDELKNKDVYVENFADEDIFARIRLEEFFEVTMNKGIEGIEKREILIGGESATETDEEGNPLHTYETFTNYASLSEGTLQAGLVDADADGIPEKSYWSWLTGGSTVYLPTFNMNKDSLQADINGTYAGEDGDPATENDRYSDYVDYANNYYVGEEVPGTEIYDADANDIDDGNVTTVENTHYIQETGSGTLMSMETWMNEYYGDPGPYWVYDTDGWVYWAQAIAPDTATGLLLNNIEMAQPVDDSWYYAINVVAQFVTADDLGRGTDSGFYDPSEGTEPSEDALKLLEKIGVDTTAVVDTVEELKDALAEGSDVRIDGEITNTDREEGAGLTWDILWHTGGTVSGGTLNLDGNTYGGLFINNEKSWPEANDGANAATLSGTTINSTSTLGIYVQAIDAPVTIENVTVTSDNGGIYAEHGDALTTLNNVTVNASNNWSVEGYDWYNSAVCAANKANVVVNSGSYTGKYAAYVFSSGATLTINGGFFDGELKEDNAELIINGGTFTVDPTEFVSEGLVVNDNGDGTWTVSNVKNVDTVEELKEAINGGNDVNIEGEITNTESESEPDIGMTWDILWHNGGTVSGGTLNLNGNTFGGLFINNENNWPVNGDGANAATLSGTTINSTSTLGIYVQAIDAPVTIENVTVTSDNGGIYAEYGPETTTLNNVTVDASNNWRVEGHDWYNSAVCAANKANVVVNGGSYTGKYAAYVFSSGATLTINDGYFAGELKADNAKLTINGGTFTADPTAFVNTETHKVVNNEDGTYTVQEKGVLSIGAYYRGDNEETMIELQPTVKVTAGWGGHGYESFVACYNGSEVSDRARFTWSVVDEQGQTLTREEHGVWVEAGDVYYITFVTEAWAKTQTVYIKIEDSKGEYGSATLPVEITGRYEFTLTNTADPTQVYTLHNGEHLELKNITENTTFTVQCDCDGFATLALSNSPSDIDNVVVSGTTVTIPGQISGIYAGIELYACDADGTALCSITIFVDNR